LAGLAQHYSWEERLKIRDQFISLAVAAVSLGWWPALAQEYTTREPDAETRLDSGQRVLSLQGWNYDNLYRRGWSADDLLNDGIVIGATGEEIGNVQNIIIGAQGRILGIIAEVGGFWDIGDTHIFIPWNEVEFTPGTDRVRIPVTEDTVENYDDGPAEFMMHGMTGEARTVDESLATSANIWKATDLIDDYVYLDGNVRYGYITDLIFTNDANLHAYVVTASAAYGGGRRALPYYADDEDRFDPGLAYYRAPHDAADIDRLETFRTERLRASEDIVTSVTDPTRDAVRWTFSDIDRDNDFELSDREFATVGSDIHRLWDRNGDGVVSYAESYRGFFRSLDRNGDNQLEPREFNIGWKNWGHDSPQALFDELDEEYDGYVSQTEFAHGLNRRAYFGPGPLDSDAGLSEEDLTYKLYDTWDRDANRILDEDEFGDLAGIYWR
jgi:uncharacterized protein YrrD